MSVGAILGISGTIPAPWLLYLFFVPAVPGAAAFVLVFLFGLLVLRKRPRSRSFATAGLWLAIFGGMSSVGLIWLAGSPSQYSDLTVAFGSLSVLSMPISLTGAAIARLPETELAGGKLIDRDRLSAILACAGASLGLVGSVPSGFTVVPALLSLICFTFALLFGVALFQKRPEGRLLAAATVYFALVGGGVDIVFPPLGLVLHGGDALWLISVGPIGMVIAGAGAVMRLRRVPT